MAPFAARKRPALARRDARVLLFFPKRDLGLSLARFGMACLASSPEVITLAAAVRRGFTVHEPCWSSQPGPTR
jgi:hypothetical protein